MEKFYRMKNRPDSKYLKLHWSWNLRSDSNYCMLCSVVNVVEWFFQLCELLQLSYPFTDWFHKETLPQCFAPVFYGKINFFQWKSKIIVLEFFLPQEDFERKKTNSDTFLLNFANGVVQKEGIDTELKMM